MKAVTQLTLHKAKSSWESRQMFRGRRIFLCRSELSKYLTVPRKAKNLHISFRKRKPKQKDSYFEIRMYHYGTHYLIACIEDFPDASVDIPLYAHILIKAAAAEWQVESLFVLFEWS